MNKINWINGQAGGTPLSAENLNQMQDNIEDAIDDVDEKFNYSTTEKVVGTWIDGKPIYRKTFTNLTFSDHLASIDISSLNVDKIFFNFDRSYLGWQSIQGLKRWAPIIQTTVSRAELEPEPGYYQSEIYTSYSKTELIVNTGKNMIILDCVVTIEYTKTTD